MYDILSLLSVLHPHLSMTQLRQFSCVVFGMLAMTGRVSMRNLSRWTSKGGSYRTVQRFFNTVLPWGVFLGYFFGRICWMLKVPIFLREMRPWCRSQGTRHTVYRVSSHPCLGKRSRD